MIDFLLAFSVLLNVVFVWYIIQLLRRFLAFQQELDEFSILLEEYRGHIDIISKLERFYGDETLGNLLRHSKSLVEECQRFQNILQQDEEEEEYGEKEE